MSAASQGAPRAGGRAPPGASGFAPPTPALRVSPSRLCRRVLCRGADVAPHEACLALLDLRGASVQVRAGLEKGPCAPGFHRRAAPIPRRCWGPWPLGSPHPAPLSLFSTLIASEQGGGAEVTPGDVVGGGGAGPPGAWRAHVPGGVRHHGHGLWRGAGPLTPQEGPALSCPQHGPLPSQACQFQAHG